MFSNNDTIVAIASSNTNQAISIIRISGSKSLEVIKRIFSKPLVNRVMTLGIIKENTKVIDESLVVYYQAPQTFTGEEVVEIYPHGGIVNTHRIMKAILNLNIARIAEKGEFSFRAFINGKLSLIKADSINKLINASTEKEAELLSEVAFHSKTLEKVSKIKNKLEKIIGEIEVSIDYPELDKEYELKKEKIIKNLEKIEINTKKILNNSQKTKINIEGIKVAIIGEPNVGKSSLINAFLNKDRAIVTSIPGTTRDSIEEKVLIEDKLFHIIDTAGLRETKNEIEKIGIQRTKKLVSESKIIILLDDINNPKPFNNKKWLNISFEDKDVIKVLNKKDTIKVKNKSHHLQISAKNHQISNLKKELVKLAKKFEIHNSPDFWNEREISFLNSFINNLNDAITNMKNNYDFSTIIVDLHSAHEKIMAIIGKNNDEDLIKSIFNNFCLGK